MKTKVATCLLNKERKLSPNEAMSAEKRPYSRAVLVDTDTLALLQSSTPGSAETMCSAVAAQRISKVGKSARNQSAYASAQKQLVRCAKECRERATTESLWRSLQISYSSRCDVRKLVMRGRGCIGMGQSQRSKFPAIEMLRVPIAYEFITEA
jgi:hypothetical protein